VVNLFTGVTTKFHANKWKSVILQKAVDLVFRLGFFGGKAFAIFQNSFNTKQLHVRELNQNFTGEKET